jgi:hypothetical protein
LIKSPVVPSLKPVVPAVPFCAEVRPGVIDDGADPGDCRWFMINPDVIWTEPRWQRYVDRVGSVGPSPLTAHSVYGRLFQPVDPAYSSGEDVNVADEHALKAPAERSSVAGHEVRSVCIVDFRKCASQ